MNSSLNHNLGNMPDPMDFFNFHEWFGLALKALKEQTPTYSYSQIIQRLSLKSRGHITQILQGTRKIQPDAALAFANLCGFQDKKAQFIQALAQFTQATTHTEKKIGLDRMVLLQSSEHRNLGSEFYILCSKWHYPVVRELVRVLVVKDDLQELAASLRPPIQVREAKEALQVLEKLGLVFKDPAGRYKQTHAMIAFGDSWKSVAIREFQMHALEMQKRALDTVAVSEREIATSIVTMSSSCAELIQQRLKEFRAELLNIIANDPNESEQVYSMNFGFFPVSAKKTKAKGQKR